MQHSLAKLLLTPQASHRPYQREILEQLNPSDYQKFCQQKDQQKETLQLLSDARISYKAQLKKIEKLATSPVLNDSSKKTGSSLRTIIST